MIQIRSRLKPFPSLSRSKIFGLLLGLSILSLIPDEQALGQRARQRTNPSGLNHRIKRFYRGLVYQSGGHTFQVHGLYDHLAAECLVRGIDPNLYHNPNPSKPLSNKGVQHMQRAYWLAGLGEISARNVQARASSGKLRLVADHGFKEEMVPGARTYFIPSFEIFHLGGDLIFGNNNGQVKAVAAVPEGKGSRGIRLHDTRTGVAHVVPVGVLDRAAKERIVWGIPRVRG